MAQGNSYVSSMASLFANLYEDTVFALHEETMAVRMVKVFTDGRGDLTRTVGAYPTITPTTVAENEDYVNPTEWTKTSLSTLTPAEVMSQATLTDRQLDTDPEDARGAAALEMGLGMAEKFDQDIFGNFSSLTGGTAGASGTTCTWSHFFAALSIMRANKIPKPWYCVMHPYSWHDLAKAAAVSQTVTNAPSFQDEVMQKWFVGNVGGVDIFTSGNVTTDSTPDAYNAMFNPQAIAFDLRRDVRIEPERDASARKWELNCTAMYAHGVWRPTWGVQIISDITTPS